MPPAFWWPWPRADMLAWPSARLDAPGHAVLGHSCRVHVTPYPEAAPLFSWQLLKGAPWTRLVGFRGPGARVPLLPGRQPGSQGAWRRQHLQGQEADKVHLQGAWESGHTCAGPTPQRLHPARWAFSTLSGREPQFISCPGPSVCTSSICMWKPSAPGGGGRWAPWEVARVS